MLQYPLQYKFKLSMYLFSFKPLKMKTEPPMGGSNNGCHSFLATFGNFDLSVIDSFASVHRIGRMLQ